MDDVLYCACLCITRESAAASMTVLLVLTTGGEEAWEVDALPGPNAEPDFFTPEDISTFYSSTYKVHYNS